jgi:general secretion pathway protein C
MRLVLNARARRLLRRVPHITVYSALELLLLSLLAVQCARLFWTFVTPLGPVGEWKAPAAFRTPVQPSAFVADFDPFFRMSNANNVPIVVTSLNLKLFGVREDRASGRGSAIIGTPDGVQRSFAVGEEIGPGVVLTAVGFDSVTISRGGAAEQIFLDQSSAPGAGAIPQAPMATPSFLQPLPPVSQSPAPVPPPADAPQADGVRPQQ